MPKSKLSEYSAKRSFKPAPAPAEGRSGHCDASEDGIAMHKAALASGFEGVIGKRKDSRYEAARRSVSWLKIQAQTDKEIAAHLEQMSYLGLPQARRKVRRPPGAEPD